MTVSYTADVANASGFGCFTKILLRWRGSVYKLIFKELMAYLSCYFLLNVIYRVVLCRSDDPHFRQLFESLKAYCSIQMSSIPMTFGLGFYVSLIVKRWWDQYSLLPWPDSLAIFIVGLLRGQDERARLMRRNVMRYTLLSYVIVLRRVSLRVRKRFPTLEHLVGAGLMRDDELKIIESMHEKCTVSKWWMPLVWATNIVEQARSECKINNDPGVQTILNEISSIRKGLKGVQDYDTISVPLVYTQVVTLAIYTYFGAALMGAQWVTPVDASDYTTTYRLPSFRAEYETHNTTDAEAEGAGPAGYMYHPLDMYVPVFLILQFIFYVGWLKVAETLINPFGEDDDDYELNYLIDRHTQVSYMIVDEMHQEHPELLKDIYWNETAPAALPYTKETEHLKKEEPKGSAEVKEEEEALSTTYYKLMFPFRGSVKQPRKRSDFDPSSEYESIDPNLFSRMRIKIRRSQMRRKSEAGMMTGRGAGGGNATDDENSIYYAPRLRKGSVDQHKSPYSASKGGNLNRSSRYAKMFGRKRSLDSSKLVVPALSQAVANMAAMVPAATTEEGEESEADEGGRRRKLNSTVAANNVYSRLANHHYAGSEECGGSVEEDRLALDRLRHLTHLSTITEQATPYNTNPSIRTSPRHYPTAQGIFADMVAAAAAEASKAEGGNGDGEGSGGDAGNVAAVAEKGSHSSASSSPHTQQKSGAGGGKPLPVTGNQNLLRMAAVNAASSALAYPPISVSGTLAAVPSGAVTESESHAYYPIGSDGSSQRPTSPRFTVEEVPNYEPILIARSPKTGHRIITSADGAVVTRSEAVSPSATANSDDEVDAPPPVRQSPLPPPPLPPTTTAKHADSPMLPKRQPVMAKMRMMLDSPCATRKSAAVPVAAAASPVPKTEDDERARRLREASPEIVITCASSETCSQTSGSSGPGSQGFDHVSTTSEELSLEKAAQEAAVAADAVTKEDAASAFDNATFYV